MTTAKSVTSRTAIYDSKLELDVSYDALGLTEVAGTASWITTKIGTIVQIDGQIADADPSGSAPVLTLPYHAVNPGAIVGTIILDDNDVASADSLAVVESATATAVTFTATLTVNQRSGGAVRVMYETSG